MTVTDDRAAEDADALDAYSSAVVRVTDALLPSVLSLTTRDGRRRPRGAGSAVVLSDDGFAVTSAHVVRDTSRGTATSSDGIETPFTVVGADPLSDLAVVRLDGAPARPPAPAPLGDAGRLRVGQLVVAIGNPLGFGGSVSAGVVSALGRSITTTEGRHARIVENVIQTDAALHPGSSGGALADTAGRVVGISTAVVGPWIGQGLGLAVPVDERSRGIVATLIAEGTVRRAWLGIGGGARSLPPGVAVRVGRDRGLGVTSVVDDSPAARAGLRPGDVVVAVDGHPVRDVGSLQGLMSAERIGAEVTVEVLRDGEVTPHPLRPVELAR